MSLFLNVGYIDSNSRVEGRARHQSAFVTNDSGSRLIKLDRSCTVTNRPRHIAMALWLELSIVSKVVSDDVSAAMVLTQLTSKT